MVCCGCALVALVALAALVYLFNRWYRKDFITGFAHKCVFVTGCDSGFGHKLAVDLDSMGVSVYAGCLSEEGAEQLRKKCSQKLKTVLVNVTDQDSVNSARDFIEKDLPPGKNLWGVVNNAGILGNMLFELSTLEDYKQLMDVNFYGPIRVNEAFIPLIKKSRGRIVQVASMFGRGCVSTPAYNCSKFAVEPYTDELRRFLSRSKVKVSTIEPGFYNHTNLTNHEVWSQVLRKKYEALPGWRKDTIPNLELKIERLRLSMANFPLAKYNDIGMVTDAMIHALGAKHPKDRYLVGYDARPYVLITGWAPDWLLDFMVRLNDWKYKKLAQKSKSSS